MKPDPDKIAALFSYHPLATETRREKHDSVNQAIINCALSIAKAIDNEAHYAELIEHLQMVRMKTNQFITYEEEKLDPNALR